MKTAQHRTLRRFGLGTLAMILFLGGSLPAAAQESAWSLGLGLANATAELEDGEKIELGGLALFGRWQHQNSGWGAMAELRGFEDNEKSIALDAGQLNLYGTYTWRRDKLARPFVKFGVSTTSAELAGGTNSDDSGAVFGGGVEIGRGRWAFHFSIDGTEAQLDVLDPDHKTAFGSGTLGVTLRF